MIFVPFVFLLKILTTNRARNMMGGGGAPGAPGAGRGAGRGA